MSNPIEVSIADGVQTIRINRPEKKNALTSAMYGVMADALVASKSDNEIKVTLFLGAPGSFSAGNDIADFIQAATSGKEGLKSVLDFLEEIIMSEKPLVAGVDGLAIGIGTTMLMHCDYVLASEVSVFKTPFTDLGLVPEAGSTLIAPRLMGSHRAFALLVMGDELTAQDIKDAGLINTITSSTDLEEQAMKAAKRLATKPPQALALSRKMVRGDRSDILERMREEAVLFEQRMKSGEAQQAFMAFMAKGKK